MSATKRERFERLAEKRVTEAIKKIQLIGNLANRYNYDYTEDHVKQILSALESELKALRNKFKDKASPETVFFSFTKKKE